MGEKFEELDEVHYSDLAEEHYQSGQALLNFVEGAQVSPDYVRVEIPSGEFERVLKEATDLLGDSLEIESDREFHFLCSDDRILHVAFCRSVSEKKVFVSRGYAGKDTFKNGITDFRRIYAEL